MEDEEDLRTTVDIREDTAWKFTWYSDWAYDLWHRLLGRLATDHEEAIENRRYMRKPK